MEATYRAGLAARFEQCRASGLLKTAPSDVDLSNFTADFSTISATSWALRASVKPEELPRVVALVLGGLVRRVCTRMNVLEERCFTPEFCKRLKDRRVKLLCRRMVLGTRPSSSSRSSSPSGSASSASSDTDEPEEGPQGGSRRSFF